METKQETLNVVCNAIDDAADPMEKVIKYAILGLIMDSVDHKQWALEMVIESLGLKIEDVQESVGQEWEPGVRDFV